MKDNIFVMISGPAASGKSTLINKMNDNLECKVFQPSQAYISLAKERNIPIERAFFDITRDDADDYFCRVCKRNQIVIGDQHLSMQHYKDSMIAMKETNVDFPNEPFISTINYDLFDKLSRQEIYTLLIYLNTSPEVLFDRAYNRFLSTGTYMRNKTINEVIEEVEAEEYYYNQLINNVNIDSCIINTDDKDSSEVLGYALRKVRKFRR